MLLEKGLKMIGRDDPLDNSRVVDMEFPVTT